MMYVTYDDYYNGILQYRESGYKYVELINGWLAERTQESISKFLRLYMEEKFTQSFVQIIPELAYGLIAAKITIDEINEGYGPRFIFNGTSIEELTAIIQQLKFYIWEYEFEAGQEYKDGINSMFKSRILTPQFLYNVIETGAVCKTKGYVMLATELLQNNYVQEAVTLVKHGHLLYPDDELISNIYDMIKGLNDNG